MFVMMHCAWNALYVVFSSDTLHYHLTCPHLRLNSALFTRCLLIWCDVWPNMVIGVDPRGLIFQSEFLILGSLLGARNKFFHENHCADFLFTDGTAHPVSGDKTKRFYLIFFIMPVFQVSLGQAQNQTLRSSLCLKHVTT